MKKLRLFIATMTPSQAEVEKLLYFIEEHVLAPFLFIMSVLALVYLVTMSWVSLW